MQPQEPARGWREQDTAFKPGRKGDSGTGSESGRPQPLVVQGKGATRWYVCTHTCIHVHTRMQDPCGYSHAHTCATDPRTHVNVHTYIHIFMHTNTRAQICKHICRETCEHMHRCVHVHTHTNTPNGFQLVTWAVGRSACWPGHSAYVPDRGLSFIPQAPCQTCQLRSKQERKRKRRQSCRSQVFRKKKKRK